MPELQNCKSRDLVDCGVLRHVAALEILLVWTKLGLVVAGHPALPCDRYLPMLTKVNYQSLLKMI